MIVYNSLIDMQKNENAEKTKFKIQSLYPHEKWEFLEDELSSYPRVTFTFEFRLEPFLSQSSYFQVSKPTRVIFYVF